jgi:hypothetical protein
MPITINGSGTIGGLNAGGLPDGSITTADIAANAVTFAKLGTTEQGQLCKAWVNFNGTGTVAIRASYNVSSITDNGTGDYTVNFTSALVDANFNAVATPGRLANNGAYITTQEAAAPTTSSVRFRNRNLSFTQEDCESMCVAIFR